MVRLSNVLQFGLGVSTVAAQAAEGLHKRIVFNSHESRSIPDFVNDISRLHRSVKRARSVVEDRDVAVKVPEQELKSILAKLQDLEKQVEGLLGGDAAASSAVPSSGSGTGSGDQNCDAENLLYSLGANASKDAAGKVSDHPMFKNANCSMDSIVSGQSMVASASQTASKQLRPVPSGFLNANQKDSTGGSVSSGDSPSGSVPEPDAGSGSGSGSGSDASAGTAAGAPETTGSVTGGTLAPGFGDVKAAVAGDGGSAGSGETVPSTGGAEVPGDTGSSPATGAPASGDLTTTVITRTRHSTITITLASGQVPPTSAAKANEKLRQDDDKTSDKNNKNNKNDGNEDKNDAQTTGSAQGASGSQGEPSMAGSSASMAATSGGAVASPPDDRKYLNGTTGKLSNSTTKVGHSHRATMMLANTTSSEVRSSAAKEVMSTSIMSSVSANSTSSKEQATASVHDESFNSTVGGAHTTAAHGSHVSPAAKSKFVANIVVDQTSTSAPIWTSAESSLTSLSVAPYTSLATTTADAKTDFIGAAFKNDTSGFRTVMVRGLRARHAHHAH